MSLRFSIRRLLKRSLQVLLLLLALAIVAGVIYEQIGRRGDRRQLPQVGRSVDIGGRSLNIYCSGEGSPTVILDSGAGAPGYSWMLVQPEVAKFTSVCWYDRAGYGWSDSAPYPRNSRAIAEDLHALLHAAGISPPYVLVGASFGGFNVRVYNALYPEEVTGVVLVDAAHEDETARAPKFLLASHRPPPVLFHPVSLLLRVMTEVGGIRLLQHFIPVAPPPPGFRPDQEFYLRYLPRQPKEVAASMDEGLVEEDQSIPQVRAAGNLGSRPLIVLTAGRGFQFDDAVLAKQSADYHNIWVHEMQAQLTRLSTRGRQVVVEKSGHGIQYEAPEFVTTAVHDVVNEIRNEQKK